MFPDNAPGSHSNLKAGIVTRVATCGERILLEPETPLLSRQQGNADQRGLLGQSRLHHWSSRGVLRPQFRLQKSVQQSGNSAFTRLPFGEKVASRDISFAIPAVRICGLLGPNGAGKPPCFG